jgi:hypothetical protein
MSMFVGRGLSTLLIVIVTMASSGHASAQTNAGQKAASPAQAPQKTAAGKSSAAVPMFVPMPKDIQCELHGVSYRSVVGANGQLNNTSGSVDGVTCWVSGKSPEQKKDIPLVSSTISDGMLQTKDFGNLKLSPTNNINSTATGMAIRSDRVQALRNFLAQASASKQSTSTSPVQKGAPPTDTSITMPLTQHYANKDYHYTCHPTLESQKQLKLTTFGGEMDLPGEQKEMPSDSTTITLQDPPSTWYCTKTQER